MSRRRRNREVDIALGMAQLVAFLVFAGMFLPQVRQMFLSVGFLLVGTMILMGVVALGAFRIRRTQSSQTLSNTPPLAYDIKVSSVQHFKSPDASPGSQPPRPSTTGDVIQQLRTMDWFQFEKLVALVYRKQGYVVTRRGGANPDGGVDLVVEKGDQRAAVQCKQWKTWNVGVKAVREFLGALTDVGIQKGVFITLCGYTPDAMQLAEKHGIEMVNEAGLARMIESTDARFDPETLVILKDTRKFCPKCESEMLLRTASKGPGAGSRFWGCSAYPRCRFTMPFA